MFNFLAVVGIAGAIEPIASLPHEIMQRDWPMVMGLTAALFVMAYGFKGEGRVNRVEGSILLLVYVVYTAWLGMSMVSL